LCVELLGSAENVLRALCKLAHTPENGTTYNGAPLYSVANFIEVSDK